jgi:hypothetical protein
MNKLLSSAAFDRLAGATGIATGLGGLIFIGE